MRGYSHSISLGKCESKYKLQSSFKESIRSISHIRVPFKRGFLSKSCCIRGCLCKSCYIRGTISVHKFTTYSIHWESQKLNVKPVAVKQGS